MSEEEEYYHLTCEDIEGAIKSQMFGKSCYKIEKKAFCCFFENEMVFKLDGQEHSEALSLDGSKLFDPSGKSRPMKQWVQVPYHYKELWTSFTKSAVTYIQELNR